MTNRRKFAHKLEDDEAAIVLDVPTLEYIIGTFRELAKQHEEYTDGWNAIADHFQYWVDYTKNDYEEDE